MLMRNTRLFNNLVCRIVLFLSAVAASTAFATAATVTTLIGSADNFGGNVTCAHNPCQAGDAYTNFASPVIAPGTYVNTTGLDKTTESPWATYVFEFDFTYDASSLSSITDATVTIQSGSLAHRSDGTGFGFAPVSANGVGLGQLWSTSTGTSNSNLEESVKDSSFDVFAEISGPTGTLKVLIDGSKLTTNPTDQFAFDFARLDIQGTTTTGVPEPSSLLLVSAGAAALLSRFRRRIIGRPLTLRL
jgi:hypothetical protein